jgi:hypothetical protein
MHRKDAEWFVRTLTKKMRQQIIKHIRESKVVAAYDETFFLTALKIFAKPGDEYAFTNMQCVYAKMMPYVVSKSPFTWNQLIQSDYTSIVDSEAFFVRKTTSQFQYEPTRKHDELVVVYIGTDSIQSYEYLVASDLYDIVIFSSVDMNEIDKRLLTKCLYVCPILWKYYFENVRAFTEMVKGQWKRIMFADEMFDTNDIDKMDFKQIMGEPNIPLPKKLDSELPNDPIYRIFKNAGNVFIYSDEPVGKPVRIKVTKTNKPDTEVEKKTEKAPRKKAVPKEPKEPKDTKKTAKIKKPPSKSPPKKQTKKKTLAEMQRQNPQDIIIPVSMGSKCPKGTRKNKEGQCILTKEFKDTFLKRKACIQYNREQMN